MPKNCYHLVNKLLTYSKLHGLPLGFRTGLRVTEVGFEGNMVPTGTRLVALNLQKVNHLIFWPQ